MTFFSCHDRMKMKINIGSSIERVDVMYKAEIKFDTKNLTPGDMDKICEETDQIFEREDLNCAASQGKGYILTVDENKIMVDFGLLSLL